jgi:hypothetical protein
MNLRKAAAEMGTPYKQAAWYRMRFLRERIKEMAEQIAWFYECYQQATCPVSAAISSSCATDLLDELVKAAKELRYLALMINGAKHREQITDEQVEAARNYPIDKLVHFERGFALAPCHEDSKPSLHHNKGRNRAHCFVCNRSFNALDYLMEFEGLKFVDAVKQLAG